MKVGLLFPGLGNQFSAMGKEFYEQSRVVQEYFEEASYCLGINAICLCFTYSNADFKKKSHEYSALFLMEVAIAQAIKEAKISVDFVSGRDIGFLGALCASGSLSFPDGLYLLSKFLALKESSPHTDASFIKQYFSKIDIKVPQIPVLSILSGMYLSKESDIKDAIVGHLNELTCDAHGWHKIMEKCLKRDIILISAPAEAMVEDLKQIYSDKKIIAITHPIDIKRVTKKLRSFSL